MKLKIPSRNVCKNALFAAAFIFVTKQIKLDQRVLESLIFRGCTGISFISKGMQKHFSIDKQRQVSIVQVRLFSGCKHENTFLSEGGL